MAPKKLQRKLGRRGEAFNVEAGTHVRAQEEDCCPPEAESQSESSGTQASYAASLGAAASGSDWAGADRGRRVPQLRALFRLGGGQGRLRGRNCARLPGRGGWGSNLYRPDAAGRRV